MKRMAGINIGIPFSMMYVELRLRPIPSHIEFH
jgi:hypothetical protein